MPQPPSASSSSSRGSPTISGGAPHPAQRPQNRSAPSSRACEVLAVDRGTPARHTKAAGGYAAAVAGGGLPPAEVLPLGGQAEVRHGLVAHLDLADLAGD